MKVSNSKERIKELLDFYNINQTEFSKRTGVQKSALSNYLNGDRSPRQDQISKIADAFNVSASWLMGYDVSMSPSPAASADPSLDADELKLLNAYRSFNATGKAKLMDYVADLESSPRNYGEVLDSCTGSTAKDDGESSGGCA